MAEVVGVYVAYREAGTIEESVRSLRPWVDRLAFYSAAFGPDAPERDNTREWAEHAAGDTPMRWVDGPPQAEADARNEALRLAADEAGPDAWALVLDGDEFLVAESTAVGRTALGRALERARTKPAGIDSYGVDIYTTALLFHGGAPDVDRAAYETLPIVASRGTQPRLFPLAGAEYRPSARGAPGLFMYGSPQRPNGLDGAVIMNLRHRQRYEDYQSDFRWETALAGGDG